MKLSKKLALGVMLSVMCAGVLPGVASAAVKDFSGLSGVQNISDATIITPSTDDAILVNGTGNSAINLNFTNTSGTTVVSLACGLWVGNTTQDIIMSGSNVKFIDASGNMCATEAGSIHGHELGKLTINNNVEIVAGNHSAISINGNTSQLDINGNLKAKSDSGTVVYSEHKLNINSKELEITAADGYDAIVTENLVINSSGDASTTKQLINGNIMAILNADITLKGNQSWFRGTVEGLNRSITLQDEARWTLPNGTIQSIENLTMNGGRIELYSDSSDHTSDYTNLIPANFSANPNKSNVVSVHTDLSLGEGDCMFVDSGSLKGLEVEIIDKQPNGETPATGSVPVLMSGTGTTDHNAVKFSGSYYDADDVLYRPLVNQHTTEYGCINYNFEGWTNEPTPDNGDSSKRTEVAVTRDAASVNMRDIDNTIKRLNDIRTDPSEVGVWIRGERGENKIRNYSYDYSIMAGGYDWHIDNDARSLFYGFGVTYSTNKCEDGIIGNSKSKGVNLYGSWLGKKHNDYVDVILKYGKLDKDYAGKDINDVKVSGEYDKKLFVISTKYGRRFYKDNGFYFEPQVGYSYGRVGSADYLQKAGTNGGFNVHADATNSHIVSFDLQVGKNIKGTETYTKLGYVYDLDGEINVYAPNIHAKDDMGGGYVRWTIGAARKVGKNNSFYIDVEKDFGSKVKKPYAVNLGYRHTF